MVDEKALLLWFADKTAASTEQVSNLEAERTRLLLVQEEINSSLERERLRLEIVDELAAEARAAISNPESPEMEMPSTPKRVLSAAVGRVKKDKKVQEIVEQVEGEESGST